MKPDPAHLAALSVAERRRRYVESILAAGGRLPREHYEKQAEKMYPERERNVERKHDVERKHEPVRQ